MNFFLKIINLGTDKVNDNFLLHKIRNANFIALLYSLLACIFLVFTYFYFIRLILFPLIFILFGISVLFINKSGNFQFSRFIICLIFNLIYTLYHAFITPASHEIIGSLYSIQIVFWIVPYLVYDFREIYYLIGYTLSYIATSLYLPELKNILEIENINIDLIANGYLSYIIYGVSLTAISGAMLFLKWQMFQTENENAQLIEVINKKNSDLQHKNEKIELNKLEIEAHSERLTDQAHQLYNANKLIEGKNDELKLLNHQLEFEINNRKNELNNTYQELIQYNHQLEEFAFFTAHNLRSPVARLLGLSNLLDLKLMSGEGQNIFVLEKIVDASKELDSIIRDLNTILEIRRSVSINMEEVVFEEKLIKIKQILKDEIKFSGTRIKTNFKVASIHSLPTYIESIFYNLISNSIKFRSFTKTPEINISTEKENDFIKIIFSDNGLGIDLEKYGDKLFGLYNKFHTHVKGKGLGLHLVNIQVLAMRGKIFVNSKVDEGTTFTIVFDGKRN